MPTYPLLRYGVPVQVAAGQAHETVHLIDWERPEKNDFALAEEVTSCRWLRNRGRDRPCLGKVDPSTKGPLPW